MKIAADEFYKNPRMEEIFSFNYGYMRAPIYNYMCSNNGIFLISRSTYIKPPFYDAISLANIKILSDRNLYVLIADRIDYEFPKYNESLIEMQNRVGDFYYSPDDIVIKKIGMFHRKTLECLALRSYRMKAFTSNWVSASTHITIH